MDSIETLKQELLLQKSVIEAKSGQVIVKNINPSPSEITEGIKTIEMPIMSLATATEQDVALGKTFYAGDKELKSGILTVVDNEVINSVFFNVPSADSEKVYAYTIPSEVTKIKKELFREAVNNVEVYFHEDIEEVCDYCFYFSKGFSFPNFNTLTKIKRIGSYSFDSTIIDTQNVPSSIETIDAHGFSNTLKTGQYLIYPNCKTINTHAFANSKLTQLTYFSFKENFEQNYVGTYAISRLRFDCDLDFPSSVKTINQYFNYGGHFNNINIPSTITAINDAAFSANSVDNEMPYAMKSFVFNSLTPPTIGKKIIATQNLKTGLKIYVPDESIDEYKANANLAAYYLDVITPMSEKP